MPDLIRHYVKDINFKRIKTGDMRTFLPTHPLCRHGWSRIRGVHGAGHIQHPLVRFGQLVQNAGLVDVSLALFRPMLAFKVPSAVRLCNVL